MRGLSGFGTIAPSLRGDAAPVRDVSIKVNRAHRVPSCFLVDLIPRRVFAGDFVIRQDGPSSEVFAEDQ